MFDLKLTVYFHSDYFIRNLAIALKEVMAPYHTAKNGDVVAIKFVHQETHALELQRGVVRFAVKVARGIAFVDYAELNPSLRPKIADVVMQLDGDWYFKQQVRLGISEKQNHLFVMANAIGYLRTVPSKPWSDTEWNQKRVDKVHRLLPSQAMSAHEAIARHDELVGLVRLWRFVLETFCHDIPCLNAPNVGDLLG